MARTWTGTSIATEHSTKALLQGMARKQGISLAELLRRIAYEY